MKEELTRREKLALLAYIHGLSNSPAAIFELACPEQYEANKYPASTATRWLQTKRVSAFVEAEKAALLQRQARHDKAIAERAIAEFVEANGISGEGEERGPVDYSNPSARKSLLNKIIVASGDDSKTQLDALKLIAAQPEGDEGEGTSGTTRRKKLVRFFVPETCESCPLHRMAGEVLQLRAEQIYNAASPEAQAQIDKQLRDAGEGIVREYVSKLITFKKSNNYEL